MIMDSILKTIMIFIPSIITANNDIAIMDLHLVLLKLYSYQIWTNSQQFSKLK